MSDSPINPKSRARAVFYQALELEAEDRERYLQDACGEDLQMLGEVRGLLSALSRGRDFLEQPLVQFGEGPSLIGTDVEGYRIEERIASGGMGTVYRAEQKTPRRPVALKLLRPQFPSESAARRFGWEAEVLGRLQHPGIARIYEAGVARTAAGPAFFLAMELIHGSNITEHAAAIKLAFRDRLELFRRVCLAVHHAHQKGVLHRDLKPSNILVDEAGRPKVLDFGVARSLEAKENGETLPGQLIGTLAYMSPEQVRGDLLELDVPSDVYSLGVVLYELLSGELPYPVRDAPLPMVARRICEDEPAPLQSFGGDLRGDVAAVVGKALRKEREARYPSAEAFAEDLDRVLHNQPVRARTVTNAYLLRKFIRRHAGVVAGLTLAALALVLGTTLSVLARFNADREAQSRRTLNEILLGMLRTPDTLRNASHDSEAREETVEQALGRLLPTLEEGNYAAAVRAPLHYFAGETYRNLGKWELAELHTSRSLELRRELYGEQHIDTAKSMQSHALLLYDRFRFADGIEIQQRCVQILDGLVGREDPATLDALNNLAILHQGATQFEEAESHYREVLQIRRRILPPDHPDLALALHNLGSLLIDRSQLDAADPLLHEGWRIRQESLPEGHPQTLSSQHALATLYGLRGDYDRSRSFLEQTLDRVEKDLGPNHFRTLVVRDYLSRCYLELDLERQAYFHALQVAGAPADALPIYQQNRVLSLRTMALYHGRQGRYDRAELLLRIALHLAVRASPRNEMVEELLQDRLRQAWQVTRQNLSEEQAAAELRSISEDETLIGWPLPAEFPVVLEAAGDLEEATQLLQRLTEIYRRVEFPNARFRIQMFRDYACCLLAMGEPELAELELLDAHEDAVETFGDEHPQTLQLLRDLVDCYEQLDDLESATEMRTELMAAINAG